MASLLHVNFYSHVLAMCTSMDVILPQKTPEQLKAAKEGRLENDTYPTLYLLHGMGGDQTGWQRESSIERYANEAGIAVVMPAVQLSSYADMKHGPKYFTFVTQELPDICRDFFPKMSPRREDTFVAGLSMGGCGALKCGICCPEVFSKAACLSGSAYLIEMMLHEQPPEYQRLLEDIFGSYEEALGTVDDIPYMAKKQLESGKPLAEIYQWCGTEDFPYQDNLRFKAYMESIGYPIVHTEGPGVHSMYYWDQEIQNVIKWMVPDRYPAK